MKVSWIAILWLGWCVAVGAAERGPADFFGEYIGATDGASGKERDLNVTIRPEHGDGHFYVEWTTVIHKPDGRTKRRTHKVSFHPSGRDNIYASAMRTTVFGGKSSLDPLNGEPLFWAQIQGDTLTVNAFMIDDSGNYVMQVYKRTLTRQGLHLEFERNHGGEPRVSLQADLVRVAD
ncbi:hypothetical protein [Motiliproteus sediminis]|uniref:hypothetical protein n=1 Tax=Motiliproteus sediminis TaxID=1468178 RepID=UPI001AEFF2C5|nr:hypothetical protein [Motiliproteus sediminis]